MPHILRGPLAVHLLRRTPTRGTRKSGHQEKAKMRVLVTRRHHGQVTSALPLGLARSSSVRKIFRETCNILQVRLSVLTICESLQAAVYLGLRTTFDCAGEPSEQMPRRTNPEGS